MADLLLRSWPMFLAPAPIGGFRRSLVATRRRGGFGVWGLCRKSSVGASDLDLVYSSESSDGSVVFRFGTASEIAEYLALKEAESQAVVNAGEEEIGEEILDTVLPEEDVEECGVEVEEDEVDRTSGSSEILIGGQISGEYVGESDSDDMVSNVLIEMPSVFEDREEGSLLIGNVGIVENHGSYETAVESGCENEFSTFEKTDDPDWDFERTLGEEMVNVESDRVLDDKSECELEKDEVNVENPRRSAEEFVVNVGEYDTHLEYSKAVDDTADGNASKELLMVSSIISDEDFESDARNQSTVLEENIVLDDTALEPEMTVSLVLNEASSYVDKEDAWSNSVDQTINSSGGNSDPVSETIDVSGYGTDYNGNIELSTTEETRISTEDFESDDEEIPVVNGNLIANEGMACERKTEYVTLQKTSTSEVIQKENTHDFGSLLGNIPESVSVVEQPSANEVSYQKGCFRTSDAAGSLTEMVPANFSTGKCSSETNVIPDAMAIPSNSSNQEDADGSNYFGTIPVTSELETEFILDERIKFYTERDYLNTNSIDSTNQTAEKDTPTTSEVTEIIEADIWSNLSTSISVSNATEQISVQVEGREEAPPVTLSLSIGAALLPRTLEALTGGEDAYFIAGETWFGVADGVGQWSLEGIDAGLYGHELMECCRRIVSDGKCCPTNTEDVLSRSAAEATLPGSATVLVAYFDGQVLHASNIGDTGFVVVRNGVILSRSSPTIYDFHFPHQIQKGDNPLEFVELYAIELNEGDIIVAATDGLFDNMYDQEIASVATKSLQFNMSPEEVAAVLAVKAQEIGRSTYTRSPFADAAQAAGYAGCTGGKLDDVAVIVSVVQKKS